MILRRAEEGDFEELLRLNEEWVHFTSPLDAEALAALHRESASLSVVETDAGIVAFLLALREGAEYASPNYRWFEERGGIFLYVDRVIVDRAHQGTGLARLLYDDLLALARRSGVCRIVCELDIDPLNEASARFHDRYGFREVGTQRVAGGRKLVSLRELGLG